MAAEGPLPAWPLPSSRPWPASREGCSWPTQAAGRGRRGGGGHSPGPRRPRPQRTQLGHLRAAELVTCRPSASRPSAAWRFTAEAPGRGGEEAPSAESPAEDRSTLLCPGHLGPLCDCQLLLEAQRGWTRREDTPPPPGPPPASPSLAPHRAQLGVWAASLGLRQATSVLGLGSRVRSRWQPRSASRALTLGLFLGLSPAQRASDTASCPKRGHLEEATPLCPSAHGAWHLLSAPSQRPACRSRGIPAASESRANEEGEAQPLGPPCGLASTPASAFRAAFGPNSPSGSAPGRAGLLQPCHLPGREAEAGGRRLWLSAARPPPEAGPSEDPERVDSAGRTQGGWPRSERAAQGCRGYLGQGLPVPGWQEAGTGITWAWGGPGGLEWAAWPGGDRGLWALRGGGVAGRPGRGRWAPRGQELPGLAGPSGSSLERTWEWASWVITSSTGCPSPQAWPLLWADPWSPPSLHPSFPCARPEPATIPPTAGPPQWLPTASRWRTCWGWRAKHRPKATLAAVARPGRCAPCRAAVGGGGARSPAPILGLSQAAAREEGGGRGGRGRRPPGRVTPRACLVASGNQT